MSTRKKKPSGNPAKKKPARAEAKRADITFAYAGQDYVIAGDNVDNTELFELVEDGKMLSAIRGFLGADQWARFKDAVRTPDGRVPMTATEEFLQSVMDAVGNLNAS